MSSPYIMYDGARVSRESELGRELEKWERPPDYRPESNPYPKMLYRAQHRPDGKRSVHEVSDHLFPVAGERGPMIVAGAAEQWSRRCQLTVSSEAEKIRAYEQGWRDTPQQALELLEDRDRVVSTATAERHYTDLRMSEKAQREAAEVDRSTLKHVPEVTPEVIKEATARKRGRPKKAVSV